MLTFSSMQYSMPLVGEPAKVAKQLILDERQLDSKPHLNLASFVTSKCRPRFLSFLFIIDFRTRSKY